MKAPPCIVVDFETEAIEQRPDYPPVPVGVAIKEPGVGGYYMRLGHPIRSNCSFSSAMETLERVWNSGLPILCHNAKFDLQVATEKLRLPMLPWQRIHDTMFLAFLADPHAPMLGLKELAADLLDWPEDEQNELHDWIWNHRAELEAAYGKKVKKSELGAWIAKAPGVLVAKYAIGDVERTHALYEHLWPSVQENGMGAAYDRERRLLPILMDNERVGIRTDQAGLSRDVEIYSKHLTASEEWLRRELRASGLNFDADRDVANVLLQRGIVPEENWQTTKSGQLSVKKDVLTPDLFVGENGAAIASALGYRNRLKTCLTMFMEPWLAQGSKRNGYISTNWNQVRSPGGGTRTGRPSTNDPNLLNISKTWGDNDGYVHPEHLPVAPLPLVRRYILPDEGGVFMHRDFDGQELRVFANVECGDLKEAYRDNPELDPHGFVGEIAAPIGWHEEYDRKKHRGPCKALNFLGLYGGGVPAAAGKLRCSLADAKKFKAAHTQALPGLKTVNDVIKAVAGRGDPIRTWGGRVYYPEPAKIVDGRRQDFIYRLINVYCQGSAADITKEAICRWHEGGPSARFLVTVYDEINVSAPSDISVDEMQYLKEVMESDWLDIKMLTTGKRGPSWGELEKCQ